MLYFFITFFSFFLYSFTREDLNLTLYKQMPDFFKTVGYYQRPLATIIFIILSIVFFVIYLKIVKQKLPAKFTWLKWAIPIGLIGILAYPMFSYDIFNYLFNVKMVLIYQANPHIRTAIEFRDTMLRFMHNIHTPAPYAYGWTIVSLLPGLVWFTKKFTLSFWAMKLFITAFWLLQLMVLKKLVNQLYPKQPFRWWLFALSPLVLIETLIVGHNDVVMMFPALLSFLYLLKSKKLFDKFWLSSIVLLFLSASIKYATIVLLPLYFLKYLKKLPLKLKQIDIPTLASWALLAVMLTRPDQLHSWYLIWGLSFAVLSKSKLTLNIFIALSFGALLRYAPYIYYGTWDSPVNLYRHLILGASLLLVPILNRFLPTSSHK